MNAITGTRALLVAAASLPWLLWALGQDGPRAMALFAPFCHQLPERTLAPGGVTMTVCSRCAGLYLGLALGALLPLGGRVLPWARPVVALTAAALGLEVLTQDLGLHPVWHPSRVLTGLAFGYALSAWLTALLVRAPRP